MSALYTLSKYSELQKFGQLWASVESVIILRNLILCFFYHLTSHNLQRVTKVSLINKTVKTNHSFLFTKCKEIYLLYKKEI